MTRIEALESIDLLLLDGSEGDAKEFLVELRLRLSVPLGAPGGLVEAE